LPRQATDRPRHHQRMGRKARRGTTPNTPRRRAARAALATAADYRLTPIPRLCRGGLRGGRERPARGGLLGRAVSRVVRLVPRPGLALLDRRGAVLRRGGDEDASHSDPSNAWRARQTHPDALALIDHPSATLPTPRPPPRSSPRSTPEDSAPAKAAPSAPEPCSACAATTTSCHATPNASAPKACSPSPRLPPAPTSSPPRSTPWRPSLGTSALGHPEGRNDRSSS